MEATKGKNLLILLFLIGAATVGFNASCKQTKKETADLQGAVITAVTGQVTVTRGDEKVQVLPDKLYTRDGLLLNGMTLETGKDSKADLQFQNGTQMRIGPQSRIKLENAQILTGENFSRTLIRIDAGNLYTRVNRLEKASNFSIITPTATAAVRGTDFLTKVENKSSTVLVQEGSVAVTDDKYRDEKVVDGGNKASSSDSKVEVKPLDEKDKKELNDYGANLQGITDQGRSQIEGILQNFEENKKQILKAIDDQKEANRKLIEGQKESNRQLIQDQIESNRKLMESRADEDRKTKEAIEGQGKENVQKSVEQGRSNMEQQKNKSELDRIRGNKPAQ